MPGRPWLSGAAHNAGKGSIGISNILRGLVGKHQMQRVTSADNVHLGRQPTIKGQTARCRILKPTRSKSPAREKRARPVQGVALPKGVRSVGSLVDIPEIGWAAYDKAHESDRAPSLPCFVC